MHAMEGGDLLGMFVVVVEAAGTGSYGRVAPDSQRATQLTLGSREWEREKGHSAVTPVAAVILHAIPSET